MKEHIISVLGRRESNEDCHTVIHNLYNNDRNMKKMNFYAVFDGHGGKDISNFLEDNYYKFFTEKFVSYDPSNYNSFKKYVKEVHKHIQSKLELRLKNMAYSVGSTSLALYFYKDKNKTYYYVINTGDSRAVLCNKNDKAVPLSDDHKPSNPKEKKRIYKLGGTVYNDGGVERVEYLSVSRSFGDMDAKPYVSHMPEISKYSLNKGDKFIILACDGLWDVMTNKQAVDFVNKELKKTIVENNYTHNKNNISKKLAQKAIQVGSYDNVSIIIIFF